jgi:hypothetical protein
MENNIIHHATGTAQLGTIIASLPLKKYMILRKLNHFPLLFPQMNYQNL